MVGIHDQNLSEQWQVDAELMMEKAKKIVRQHEAVRHYKQKLANKRRRQIAGSYRQQPQWRQRPATKSKSQLNRGVAGPIRTNQQCTRYGNSRLSKNR